MVLSPTQTRSSSIDLFLRVPYFASQPREVLEMLADAAVAKYYPAGSIIFSEGEMTCSLYVVESGIVKICRIGKDGREHILHFIYPGDTFNDVAVMDGGPNPATAVAYTDATTCCISRSDLQHIARCYPSVAWALLESIARRTRHLIGVVENLSMRNVRGRLAHLLLEEAEAQRTHAIPRMLTQQEMASRLGTVREMVGRALRGLAADGIIEFDRHQIVILDPERLAEEAEV